jgi:hypothetical protein
LPPPDPHASDDVVAIIETTRKRARFPHFMSGTLRPGKPRFNRARCGFWRNSPKIAQVRKWLAAPQKP